MFRSCITMKKDEWANVSAIVLIVFVLMLLIAVLTYTYFLPMQNQNLPPIQSADPHVSIGCDRVFWNDDDIALLATVQNIVRPEFEWAIDGKVVENADDLAPGEHQVRVNVNYGDQTLHDQKTLILIDSTDGISLSNFQFSYNQWKFQTLYKGKQFGVNNVRISIDHSAPIEVNSCGYIVTKPLFAGGHIWQAEYRGNVIASGTFTIREKHDIKINSIEVASSYRAGDTVNGNIVLTNMGSTTITGFEIKTLVINHKYKWMGDQAKKEYHDKYTSELVPGGKYKIPIRVTIPEKVSGIKPTGDYSITITLILNGQTIDTKVVNTKVV